MARVVVTDPEDREALYWRGYLSFLAGDLGLAERYLSRLLQASLAASDERGIYRGHLRLGEVFIKRGNLKSARERFDQAHEITSRNTVQNPDDFEWQRDLSVSKEKIGDALIAQGNLSEAMTSFRDSLTIRDHLATTDPNNAGWQRDLSVSYEKVGDVLVAQRNLPEALKLFRDGLDIRDHLAKADPTNVQWEVDVVVSHWKLAANGDDPARRWSLIVTTLRKLKAEDKLTAEQAKRLPEAEARLAEVQKR